MKGKDDHINLLLKRIPENPGVYQYFDKDGQIIYVGKAKNLHRRVNSYFNKDHQSLPVHLHHQRALPSYLQDKNHQQEKRRVLRSLQFWEYRGYGIRANS